MAAACVVGQVESQYNCHGQNTNETKDQNSGSRHPDPITARIWAAAVVRLQGIVPPTGSGHDTPLLARCSLHREISHYTDDHCHTHSSRLRVENAATLGCTELRNKAAGFKLSDTGKLLELKSLLHFCIPHLRRPTPIPK